MQTACPRAFLAAERYRAAHHQVQGLQFCQPLDRGPLPHWGHLVPVQLAVAPPVEIQQHLARGVEGVGSEGCGRDDVVAAGGRFLEGLVAVRARCRDMSAGCHGRHHTIVPIRPTPRPTAAPITAESALCRSRSISEPIDHIVGGTEIGFCSTGGIASGACCRYHECAQRKTTQRRRRQVSGS